MNDRDRDIIKRLDAVEAETAMLRALVLDEPADVTPGNRPAPPEPPTLSGPPTATVGEPYVVALSGIPAGVEKVYVHFDDGEGAGAWRKPDAPVEHVFREAAPMRVIRAHFDRPDGKDRTGLEPLRIEVRFAEASSPAPPPAPVVEQPAEAEAESTGVGLNLAFVNYYAREQPFVDLAKGWSEWELQEPKPEGQWGWQKAEGEPNEDAPEPDVDARGYVRSLGKGQRAMTIWKPPAGGATGPHVLSWEGTGRLSIGLRPAEESRADGPNRIVIDLPEVQSESVMQVILTGLDASDPVRNIRLVPEGQEDAGPLAFRERFLDRWSWVTGFRYMDWGRTNGNPLVRWEDRPRVEDRTWSGNKGVPLEVMIAHANATRTNPWFCVPHAADDAYVRAMMSLIRDTLDPGLVPSIEFSNELSFNFNFEQTQYAIREAEKLGVVDWIRWQGIRIKEVFGIVAEVFANRPVRRVVSTQASFPYRMMDAFRDTPGLADATDAIAVAPYFGERVDGPKSVAAFMAMDAPELAAFMERALEKMLKGIAGYPGFLTDFAKHRDPALPPVELVAYEGGVHFLPEEDHKMESRKVWEALADKVRSLGKMPENRALFERYLTAWADEGFGDFMLYESCVRDTHHGDWGLIRREDATLDKSPKLAGVLDFLGVTP